MQPPEEDVKGDYYTTLGITLFQMVEQNVHWVAHASWEGFSRTVVMSIYLSIICRFRPCLHWAWRPNSRWAQLTVFSVVLVSFPIFLTVDRT